MNPYMNREWMIENYLNSDASVGELGCLAGCAPQTIYTWAHRFGLKRGKPSYPDAFVRPLDLDIFAGGESARIELSGSDAHTTIDANCHDWLNQWKWHLNPTGYVNRLAYDSRTGRSKLVLMHRLIMDVVRQPRTVYVDHIDFDACNNRYSNLRICTSQESARNRRVRADSLSGYKGVRFHQKANRWTASINIVDKSVHLGMFATAIEAARAYDDSAAKYFGEFAVLNFPGDVR